MEKANIFWFRRGLRLDDNAALYHALKSDLPVLPIFIFDKDILDKLEDKKDRRVEFISNCINDLQKKLLACGSSMEVYHGFPQDVFSGLINKYNVAEVFTNDDYEPYALTRDRDIKSLLNSHGIKFSSFKDHVIFEKDEVVKDDQKPYTVFTPYSRKWLSRLNEFPISIYPTEKYFDKFYKQSPQHIPSLNEIGFIPVGDPFPEPEFKSEIISRYHTTRDFPGVQGTSKLGVHLRFGTVSIRKAALVAQAENPTYLNELIWREFYQMIMWHFPEVGNHKAFKPNYENIKWRNNEEEFKLWCKGVTGYPIVDAGMRELNATGFMHNRVRMIVASFLVKHLLIDWRWGEAYFAEKLLDYEFASNNGGWQWAAGSGCDAAPYFRIFNPYLQTKKFDKDFSYIKKWVPEFQEFDYPKPIVEHEVARKRALQVFGEALKKY